MTFLKRIMHFIYLSFIQSIFNYIQIYYKENKQGQLRWSWSYDSNIAWN